MPCAVATLNGVTPKILSYCVSRRGVTRALCYAAYAAAATLAFASFRDATRSGIEYARFFFFFVCHAAC